MAIRYLSGINVDSSTLFVDDSNNRVGIGTASPVQKLHIDGGASHSYLHFSNTDTGSTDSDGVDIGINTSEEAIIWQRENNIIKFGTNATERMRIDASGNVGIGTTSPDVKLEVVVASPTDGIVADFVNSTNAGGTVAAIKLSNADSEACDVVLGANRVGANFGSDFFISLSDGVDGTNQERLRITESGNVGIGTTSPAQKLDVDGAIAIGGGTFVNSTRRSIYLDSFNAGGGAGIFFRDGFTYNASITAEDHNGASADGICISGYDGVSFSTGANTRNERMRIASNGNVGIGTTSPSHKLDIYSNENVPLRIHRPSNANLDSSGAWGIGFSTRGDAINSTTDTRAGIFSYYNGNLFLAAANTSIVADPDAYARLTVLNTGYVGIGTTSPANKLHVVGSSSDTAGTGLLRIEGGGGGGNVSWTFRSTVTNNDLTLDRQYAGAYYQALTFQRSSGNVGIGTTSPNERLSVNGNIESYDTFILNYGSNGNKWQQLFDGANSWNLRYYNGSSWSGSAITVNTSNNVGIGTTSPAYTLDVNGSAGIYGDLNFTKADGVGINAKESLIITIDSDNNDTGRVFQIKEGSGNTLMVVQEAGNVGIGTTSPGAKLDVAGDVRVQYANSSTTLSSGGSILRLANSDTTANNISAIDFPQSSAGSGFSRIGVIYKDRTSSSEDQDMFFRTIGGGTSAEVMRLTSDGNVGIGTTSPSLESTGAGLDILNSSYTQLRVRSSASSAGIEFKPSAGHKWEIQASNTDATSFLIYDRTLEVYRLVINTSGNVGIGTTSPQTELHVKGNNGWGEVRVEGQTFASGHGGSLEFYSEGTALADIYANTSKDLILRTNGSAERMRITSGGNVGIGTTSPDSLLEIENNPAAQSQTRMLSLDNNPTSNQGSGYIEISSGSNNQAKTQIEQVSSGGYGLLGNQYIDTNIINRGLSAAAFGNINFATGSSTSATSIVMTIGGGSQKGNVGIGTTSPSTNLHVAGSVRVTGDRIDVNSNTRITGAYYENSNTEYTYIDMYNGGNASINIGTKHPLSYISFESGNGAYTERMRITNTGNVGIGTTSPSSILDVRGASAYFHLGNTSDTRYVDIGHWATGNIQVEAGNGNLYLKTQTSHYLALGTTNSERLRIDSSGNVGINTTSPQDFLHIRTGLGWGARITYTGDDSYLRLSSNQIAAFNSSNGAADLYLNANSSGNVLFTGGGNVGIGTASPAYKLDVIGTMRIAGNKDATNLRIAANLSTASGTAYQNYNELLFENTGATYGNAGIRHLGNAWLDSKSALAFFTSSNTGSFDERMRIDASGNVGIGTTAPGKRLDISHDGNSTNGIRVTNSDTGTSARASLTLTSDSATVDFYATSNAYNGVSGWNDAGIITTSSSCSNGLILNSQVGGIKFQDATSTIMVVSDGGNVGIGTTSPGSSFKLDVNGYIKANSRVYVRDSTKTVEIGTDYIQSYVTSGTGVNPIRFFTGSTEKARIDGNGNVGIGTTSPSYKLAVYNSSTTDSFPIVAGSPVSAGEFVGIGLAGYIAGNGAVKAGMVLDRVGIYGTGDIHFLNNSTLDNTDATLSDSKIVIKSSGNVGIGTDSPKTKVDINGTIGFGSKSVSLSDTFADVLTVNMNAHTGCYVKITAFGDWSSHSSIAYLGEFFLQNGANSYNEPGVIIRQVDNTASDDVQAQIVDIDGTGAKNLVIQLKTTSSSGTPVTAYIQYEVRGQYNSVS